MGWEKLQERVKEMVICSIAAAVRSACTFDSMCTIEAATSTRAIYKNLATSMVSWKWKRWAFEYAHCAYDVVGKSACHTTCLCR